MKKAGALRAGVISDTHGLMRPETRAFLVGCDYIIHGGDVGSAAILDELAAIAPLTVVRGNNDSADWASGIRATELIRLGDVFVYVVHDIADLDIEPQAAQVRVVVSGHSHKPKVETRDGVTYLNPGSCGPRRFTLPISVGEIAIEGGRIHCRTLQLKAAGS